MTSIAEGLFKSLPKPKYTGENEELPAAATQQQHRGPRVLGPEAVGGSQVVLRVSYSLIFHLHESLSPDNC
jgi:SNW domain-containing protein 1